MQKLKIAATGLSGLVGSRIKEILDDTFDFISLSHSQIDISNPDAVMKILPSVNFDVFLHLAAYTNVDAAEKYRDAAWQINVTGTKNIFNLVKSMNKKFVLISTDFVFDGVHPPFLEDSPTGPISYYGITKNEAEKIVRDNAMIVRIAYPYRTDFLNKTDFVRSIKNLLENKTPLLGVTDQIITPTFIDDIAHGLKYLINNYTDEIFHLVGSKSLSAYDAIMAIAHEFSLPTELVSQSQYDFFYKNKAKRPKNGTITSKRNQFYYMRSLYEGLREIKKQLGR